MGHSWGGVVTLAAAADRPHDVSALVLLDSGQFDYADRPGTHPEWSLEERGRRDRRDRSRRTPTAPTCCVRCRTTLRRPLTDAYARGPRAGDARAAGRRAWNRSCHRADPGRRAARHARRAVAEPVAGAGRCRRTRAAAARDRARAEVRAANDEGARDVAARHPGADIRALPGWGHDLIGDGGPALAAIIADWLRRRSARRVGEQPHRLAGGAVGQRLPRRSPAGRTRRPPRRRASRPGRRGC